MLKNDHRNNLFFLLYFELELFTKEHNQMNLTYVVLWIKIGDIFFYTC